MKNSDQYLQLKDERKNVLRALKKSAMKDGWIVNLKKLKKPLMTQKCLKL